MLLKAAILHRGGRIREKRANQTIGFDACVRRLLSDGRIKFLEKEQALVLQTINGLRDAAQHHLLDISEGQLYIHMPSGVTLFRDLLKSVLSDCLREGFPVCAFAWWSKITIIKLFPARCAEAAGAPHRFG
jgi:hypothetical protein